MHCPDLEWPIGRGWGMSPYAPSKNATQKYENKGKRNQKRQKGRDCYSMHFVQALCPKMSFLKFLEAYADSENRSFLLAKHQNGIKLTNTLDSLPSFPSSRSGVHFLATACCIVAPCSDTAEVLQVKVCHTSAPPGRGQESPAA